MKKTPKKSSSKPKKSKKHPVDTVDTGPIRPISDRILIKEIKDGIETKTASGIIIPISASEDKGSKRGEVIAVGLGRMENGKAVPVSVKVGEKVLFQWGDKIVINDIEYYMVRESEILAVIK